MEHIHISMTRNTGRQRTEGDISKVIMIFKELNQKGHQYQIIHSLTQVYFWWVSRIIQGTRKQGLKPNQTVSTGELQGRQGHQWKSRSSNGQVLKATDNKIYRDGQNIWTW